MVDHGGPLGTLKVRENSVVFFVVVLFGRVVKGERHTASGVPRPLVLVVVVLRFLVPVVEVCSLIVFLVVVIVTDKDTIRRLVSRHCKVSVIVTTKVVRYHIVFILCVTVIVIVGDLSVVSL